MTFGVVLTLHIIGACVTGLVAAYASVVLWRRADDAYRSCAAMLGALVGFETISGVALGLLAPNASVFLVCRNFALYMSVWFVLEALLFARMKKLSRAFPVRAALYLVVAGAFALLAALSWGL